MGGVSSFAAKGEKILLKPNVLVGSNPDKAVTTHPAVFKSTGELFKTIGATVLYGDSPSFGSSEGNLKRSGLKQVGEETGFILADFDHGREVSHKSALLVKKFTFANGALDADGIVSLCKFKTHGFMRFTGAVKNQFGCIPGRLKGQFHVKMSDPHQFAAMLVDINTYLKPRLYIMDGILAMDGNGPYAGKPRNMNVLLFSKDPIALDVIACKMIHMNPVFVPTMIPGEKAGLGTYHYENIQVIGDDIQQFMVDDFDIVRRPVVSISGGKIRMFIRNRTTPRPVIDRSKCTACGTCVRMCPVGPTALDWMLIEGGKKPKHNYNNCIRCYCCQETCPQGAIKVTSPLLGRILFRK
jgi:uncharacterized protein (DUF362 family)/NAD-dependent dihydropyrimidine dehydrogenase PreA subunit